MDKRLLTLLLAVLVVAGGVVGVVLALGGDDDGGETGPTTTTAGPVSATGEELLDRLGRAEGVALHVVLSSDPADVETSGQDLTVELWRSADGQVRQDLLLAAGSLDTATRSLQRDDGDYFCQRATEGGWTCQEIRSGSPGEGERSGLVESAAGDLQGADVTTSDTEILGRPARCYEIEGATGLTSTLCVGEDGTPLRLAVQGQVLTATVVDDELPADVFELPAEPTPAPTTTTG